MNGHATHIEAGRRRTHVDRRVVHFLRHLGEMTLVMLLGMAALYWPFEQAFAAVPGGILKEEHVELLAMALSMAAPMAAWMRYRGHGWPATAEMSAAMILPAIALLATARLDLISGDAASSLQHALMLPSMVAAMLWRRREYVG
jgi:flagellar biosynthetic protein FliP